MLNNLFTGKVFPEKVLKRDFDRVITIEFEVLFRNTFTKALTEFCEENDIKKIYLESLFEYYSFKKEFSPQQIESQYIDFFKNEPNNEKAPNTWNYYMITSDFAIFSDQSQFALYANRGFDVGVLAVDKSLNIEMFKSIALNIPMKQGFEEMQFDKKVSKEVYDQFKDSEFFFDKH